MPDKSEAVIAVKKSIKVDVEAGKTYAWCSCGRSENQPFCDGSHAGTGFSPVMYVADESRRVGFCGCKHTEKPPLCDGAHKCL
jgi:CDGSH-type Zn-finger protein